MSAQAVTAPRGSTERARVISLGACIVLIVQFLLGMVANLFVAIPRHHPGAQAGDYVTGAASATAWAISHGSPWLAAHVALGLALAVAGLANVFAAPATGSKAYAAAAGLGALAIVGAGFNGASFVSYGHDVSSMIMAGLWAVALSCYIVCLYLVARPPAGRPAPG